MSFEQRHLFEDLEISTDAGSEKQQLAYLFRCPPELIDSVLILEAWDAVTGGNVVRGIREKLATLSNLTQEALVQQLRETKFRQICQERVQTDVRKEADMRITLAECVKTEMKRKGLRRS